MNSAVVRAAHVSGLYAVRRELAALRHDLLRSAVEENPVLRISALTLVVVSNDEAALSIADPVVAHIAGRHTARVILVAADAEAPPEVAAEVSLACSTTRHGSTVCTELIRLRVGGEAAFHLRSVVEPLLLSDVPVVLWLAGAPPLAQALASDVALVCARVVVDADAYEEAPTTLAAIAEAALRPTAPSPVADLAWVRGSPWREIVAETFDHPRVRPWAKAIRRVRVVGTQALSASFRLLGGWAAERAESVGPPVELIWASSGGGSVAAGTAVLQIEVGDAPRGPAVVVEEVEGTLHSRAATGDETVAAVRRPARSAADADTLEELLADVGADPLHLAALRRATSPPPSASAPQPLVG